MKIEDNHYTYRIETKDSQGALIDFVDIDTVEPLRCAYDVQDELNLETNEHIKRVEEIVLNATSEEFWYVDEARTSDTHLVCYFEEVQLMANADHPMVDTDRSIFEYGKINSNEHQNTNFICTHVLANGVSRIYMSIDKEQLTYQVFNNETIKDYIANNPITIWYAIRYPVVIPRSMSKGHLLTLSGQTDISISSNGDCGLPLVKFNIGDTQYNMDVNPIHLSSTTEGTQIRNIVLEGNTPINYARGNGVNTTEATSDTRYDFAPFYDGQATIPNTVEGGYVSAKLYGDTMVNIAKPYGETPLLTATNASTLCDDLLGTNEEGIVLADGEITEGRIYGDSLVNILQNGERTLRANGSFVIEQYNKGDSAIKKDIKPSTNYTLITFVTSNTLNGKFVVGCDYSIESQRLLTRTMDIEATKTGVFKLLMISANEITKDRTFILRQQIYSQATEGSITYKQVLLEGDYTNVDINYFDTIGSVVNPTVYSVPNQNGLNLFDKNTYSTRVLLSTGELQTLDSSNYWTSDYIPVFSSNSYEFSISKQAGETCFYDINKNFIWYTNMSSGTVIPPQDGYIRFTFNKSIIDTLQFGIEGTISSDDYKEYKPYLQQATLPYTLNKLPNGVADYIDVVNKIHVQRVGRVVLDGTQSFAYKSDYSNAYYYGYQMNISPYNSVNGKNEEHGLCNKLRFQKDYHFEWETEGEYVVTSDYKLFIKLSKDKLNSNTVESLNAYLQSNPITVLYELKTPIYTPLTEEEITQLPLSAYKDGYVNLSSDQLTPSFEFRMRASNRYQVDMLETGYYYLNAPMGNVKLGTANVDVQQMPCIVKVDNVGSGDSGYRLSTSKGYYKEIELTIDGYYLNVYSGELIKNSARAATDFIEVDYYDKLYISEFYKYFDICFYDENKNLLTNGRFSFGLPANRVVFQIPSNAKYFRISFEHNGNKKISLFSPITLAKLPSHRIPTSFTQGMRCTTDFGYWEGIKVATGKQLYVSETNQLNFNAIELNRIEYNNTIVEDEFDIATCKFTKRIGKYTIDGNSNLWIYTPSQTETATYASFACSRIPNFKKGGRCIGFLGIKIGAPNSTNSEESWHNLGVSDSLYFRFKKDRYSYYGNGIDGVKAYFNANPTTIYYELEIPEISYIDLPLNTLRTLDASTTLQVANQSTANYLIPQVKPSHLTYPVPSLVGNRTYTVVHNRKNITGSTKPITLDLGGTQVELNDASGKTLVKTPSTLKHSSLIFIGGESTVDHIMVLDGDWTNKPIEYFENMKGHDTDAIITIIGDGKIDDVAEQYLW